MQEFDLESQEPKIIKTQDENGEIHNFELIDVISVEGQEYGLLIHLDDNEKPCGCSCGETCEEEEDEDEVIIMRLSKQDDAYTFESIENDEEFDKVVNYLENESEFLFEDDEEEEQ